MHNFNFVYFFAVVNWTITSWLENLAEANTVKYLRL